MKKILYIITKSNWGGAQRYVYDLATTIPKDEYKISVLTGSFGVLTDKLEAEGVEILQTNSFQRNINPIKDIVSFFKILKILRKEKPDIIHVNSSKIGGLGALAGRLVGTKNIIFTAHGWPFREDRGDLQKIIIKFLSFLTVFLSHKTICVSKIDFEEAENWPFCKNKVLLIHNGIKNFDLHIRDEARRKILEKIVSSGGEFIDEKSVIIGSIGELHKNKGYKYAIKAMNKLSSSVNDFRYIIMGEGEERDYLENKIADLDLEKKVFLFGFNSENRKLLSGCDIFLLPSIKEGLPYVLTEAGFAGLPVIATDVGGVSEIIENLKNGILIRPKDEKEIFNALKFAIENKDELEKFSQNIKEKVEKKFSLEKMISKTLKIYQM